MGEQSCSPGYPFLGDPEAITEATATCLPTFLWPGAVENLGIHPLASSQSPAGDTSQPLP